MRWQALYGFRLALAIGITLVAAAEAFAAQDPSSTAPAGYTRPPLAGDPMSYSQEELMRGDYPRRPDPVSHPPAYAHWLEQVSRPATILKSASELTTPTSSKGTSQGTESPNWGGYEVDNDHVAPYGNIPYTPYYYVQGEFLLPTLQNSPAGQQVSQWVGIDGESGSFIQPPYTPSGVDLFQAGITSVMGYDNATHYQAWFEFLPFDRVSRNDTSAFSANLRPGDAVLVAVCLGPASGGCSAGGTYLRYYMSSSRGFQTSTGWTTIDYSGQSACIQYGGQSGFQCLASWGCTSTACPVYGASAEWILERSGSLGSNNLDPLPQFGEASFAYGSVEDTAGTFWTIDGRQCNGCVLKQAPQVINFAIQNNAATQDLATTTYIGNSISEFDVNFLHAGP